MLKVSAGLTRVQLAAGEPLALELQVVDTNGLPQPIGQRAFAVSIYRKARDVIDQILGILLPDGMTIRFEEDGALSNRLVGELLPQIELAERFRNGRDVIGSGLLVVDSSALTVPSLDAAPLSGPIVRVKARPSADVSASWAMTIERVAYVPLASLTIATASGASAASGLTIAGLGPLVQQLDDLNAAAAAHLSHMGI